jgi:hypothetical protein
MLKIEVSEMVKTLVAGKGAQEFERADIAGEDDEEKLGG